MSSYKLFYSRNGIICGIVDFYSLFPKSIKSTSLLFLNKNYEQWIMHQAKYLWNLLKEYNNNYESQSLSNLQCNKKKFKQTLIITINVYNLRSIIHDFYSLWSWILYVSREEKIFFNPRRTWRIYISNFRRFILRFSICGIQFVWVRLVQWQSQWRATFIEHIKHILYIYNIYLPIALPSPDNGY